MTTTELTYNKNMNDISYIVELYDYSITKNNYKEGEDPSTVRYYECVVRQIKFDSLKELKENLREEIAQRVLFDRAYRDDMFITHPGLDNHYYVEWTSEEEDINIPVSKETMEKFKNGEVDIYNGQMMIYIYEVVPFCEDEWLDFV